MKPLLPLVFAGLLAFVASGAFGQDANLLWSWDQASGDTKYGAYDPQLRLFIGCGDRRAQVVPKGAALVIQPGKTCNGAPPPRIYGIFGNAEALYASARRSSGLTCSKSAFFKFLRSPKGGDYLNAARANDAAQMFISLQSSGLRGTVVPGTTAGPP